MNLEYNVAATVVVAARERPSVAHQETSFSIDRIRRARDSIGSDFFPPGMFSHVAIELNDIPVNTVSK